MNYYNLRLPKQKELSIRDKAFADAKYNIIVNKDRLASAEVKFLTNDRIMKSQSERLLRAYVKLLFVYDEYDKESLDIDKILKDANELQYKLLCLYK